MALAVPACRCAVPVVATLALAVGMFFLPDFNVRDDAKKARVEFVRALGAYIDLVALERNSRQRRPAGDGGRRRRRRQLGVPPARRGTGPEPLVRASRRGRRCTPSPTELGLPELDDLADIMRLSGEEGAQIYTNLRARSRQPAVRAC